MVYMTLNDLFAKLKVIHFSTNRFVVYSFLGVNSNFCSRMHPLATIHNVTDDRQTTE